MICILNLHAHFEYGVSIQLKCLLFVNINMHIKPRHVCSLQGGMENLGKHVKGPSHDGICSGNTAGW